MIVQGCIIVVIETRIRGDDYYLSRPLHSVTALFSPVRQRHLLVEGRSGSRWPRLTGVSPENPIPLNYGIYLNLTEAPEYYDLRSIP